MKIEDQVCSFGLARQLQKFGVTQQSLFYWEENIGFAHATCRHHKDSAFVLCPQEDLRFTSDSQANWSAFTVAELGEMLPIEISNGLRETRKGHFKNGIQWQVMYANAFGTARDVFKNAYTEADARALMLIYLLENNLTSESQMG